MSELFPASRNRIVAGARQLLSPRQWLPVFGQKFHSDVSVVEDVVVVAVR